MTRIVAGTAGVAGSPNAALCAPTADRVREALFNVLAARLDFDGLRVLDLYAGSGARNSRRSPAARRRCC